VITRFWPLMTTSEPETPMPLTRFWMMVRASVRLSALGAPRWGARGQGHPRSALQVDAQLGGRRAVAGEEHQQVERRDDRNEHGQIAYRSDLSR